eukprot:TRINITY_DN2124_c1_g1_i2.p4 TRINITY_DN2124_c1_g1~~TRINITY_DN2124_c1_g1_i2.p4  ORF type:complete len:100 (+),score=8.03 TRINITY_DN2124_c1_g1_i2:974-1273(+)
MKPFLKSPFFYYGCFGAGVKINAQKLASAFSSLESVQTLKNKRLPNFQRPKDRFNISKVLYVGFVVSGQLETKWVIIYADSNVCQMYNGMKLLDQIVHA